MKNLSQRSRFRRWARAQIHGSYAGNAATMVDAYGFIKGWLTDDD